MNLFNTGIAVCLILFSSFKNTYRDELFNGFATLPADARPFVRWRQDGNNIQADSMQNLSFPWITSC